MTQNANTDNSLPNVIFIVADQLKATALQMYSEIGIPTPSLERMASEGVMYRHAVTPHALCVPARVSMMTSRYAHSTGARRNETLMPSGQLHAFRIWKELGYTTGLIGKNHCFIEQDDLDLLDVRCEMSHGGLSRNNYKGEIAGNKGMEWVVPEDIITEAHSTRSNMPEQSRSFGYAVTDHPIEGYSSAALTTQTKAFIDRFGSSTDDANRKPFALLLSYPDPHHPLEAPRKYADMVPPESVVMPPQRADEYTDGTIPTRNRQLHDMLGVSVDDPEHVRNAMSVYLAMTRFVDDAVGEVLDHLDETGLRETPSSFSPPTTATSMASTTCWARAAFSTTVSLASRCSSHGPPAVYHAAPSTTRWPTQSIFYQPSFNCPASQTSTRTRPAKSVTNSHLPDLD